MKPKELEKLTKSIGLFGEVDECVLGSLYAAYRCNPYNCISLVYMPGGTDKNVYIADKLEWYECEKQNKHIYYIKPPNRDKTRNMTKLYPKYKMTDDEQIKQAIGNLARELKRIQCDIKKHQIGLDFKME